MANVDNSAWDASKAWANGAASDDPASFYNGICAGKKAGDPATQGAHALPHHYHPGDAPNAAGVKNALSRIGQTNDLTNKAAAQSHLDGHMTTINAAKKSFSRGLVTYEVREKRRSAVSRGELPAGIARMSAFPSEMRANLITKDGRQFYEVEGYATVFNRAYEMWDMFGPFMETMDGRSLDQSLSKNPDVAFLLNHKGMTMARTTNGTLDLNKELIGLKIHALLNSERTDVQDLARAINDELIDEMSFAFLLEDGEWNDDFDEFRILQADINRGDVSAVNYGANPFTSIGARAQEFMRLAREVPPALARGAVIMLAKREDVRQGVRSDILADLADISNWTVEDLTGDGATETRAPAPDPVKPADGVMVPDDTDTDPDDDDDTDSLSETDPEDMPTEVKSKKSTAELAVNLSDTEDDETLEIPDGETRAKPSGIPVNLVRNRLAAMCDDDD